MPNEYSADGKIILRSSDGTQMSLARFFELALDDGDGHVAIPSQGKTSSFDPNHHAWDMHSSGLVDVIPVRTPTWGTVTRAGDGWNGGMGTCAIVTDENGLEHRFMHMVEGSLQVASGDTVAQGDTLGRIGNTGDSTGAHLHYDVLRNGSRIDDPIDAYDSATLPMGWNMVDAAANHNWNYIQLDDSAVDYGPPGGDTPSEPFFTDGYCYDVSTWQTDAEVQTLCNDSATGGIILRFAWNDGLDSKVSSHLAKCQAAGIPVGFYSASDKNITADGTAAYKSMLESQIELLYTTLGIKPEDCKLGIWLDLETWDVPAGSSGCGVSSNPDDTVQQIDLFREVFGTKNYPVLGFYCNRNELTESVQGYGLINATTNAWKSYPFWYARPGASRNTVDSELETYGLPNGYLWQDGDGGQNWSPDKTYTHTNVDNDTVLQPIPTSGGGGGGGGGGGEYTEVIKVTVDVKPPKRIYFNPNPGLIDSPTDLLSDRSATITLTTDADNADLYYTTDGSSPYQYSYVNGNLAYAVAANAQRYESSIIINKDTHIRVVAVPTGTGLGGSFEEPLAKGSGTYLFKYHSLIQSWEDEQKSYATSEGDVSFFEENRQAFLRLHAEQTDEEILYAATYKHDTQVIEENAEDAASGTGEATPEEGEERTTPNSEPEPEPNDEEGD